MAKMSKKKAMTGATSILKSMFKTPAKCSKAGSKLAGDKSSKASQSKAGSTLGSMSCKAPARRSKFTR